MDPVFAELITDLNVALMPGEHVVFAGRFRVGPSSALFLDSLRAARVLVTDRRLILDTDGLWGGIDRQDIGSVGVEGAGRKEIAVIDVQPDASIDQALEVAFVGGARRIEIDVPVVGSVDELVRALDPTPRTKPAVPTHTSVAVPVPALAPSPPTAPPSLAPAPPPVASPDLVQRRRLIVVAVGVTLVVTAGATWVFIRGRADSTSVASPIRVTSSTGTPATQAERLASPRHPSVTGDTSGLLDGRAASSLVSAATTSVPTVTTAAPTTTTAAATTTPPMPTTGVITGTCDEGTSCGVKQRSAPRAAADRLVAEDLKDGVTVRIACSTSGDPRSSGGTTSSTWFRLENGAFIPAVFIKANGPVSPCP